VEARTPQLDTATAAAQVSLSPAALESLVSAGYLEATWAPGQGLRFRPADLEAFVARNSGHGLGALRPAPAGPDLDPQELVAALDERAGHMALRMLKMYATVFPQAGGWPVERQGLFVRRTKERFEAIMAVALGEHFDEELLVELSRIGARSARAGVELPQVLLLLRISRDLVVQNAIEIAGSAERPGSFALSLLLTRILPAMDRLGDALTAGYWEAIFPGS
jgi:hypothetical protein